MQQSRRRVCPVVERMEARLVLSANSAHVSRLLKALNAVNAPYSVQNTELNVYSRQSGVAELTISRTKQGSASAVEVIATSNPNSTTSAVAGSQFQPIDQVVNFVRGQSTQTVNVPLIPGTNGPDPATILVELKPVGTSGTTHYQNVTIVNRTDVSHPHVVNANLISRGSSVYGVKVTFDKAMDPNSVADARRYVLTDTHKTGVGDWMAFLTFHSRNQGTMKFRTGSYDSASNTLTLYLAKPVKNLGRYQFAALWGQSKGTVSPPTDSLGNTVTPFSLSLS